MSSKFVRGFASDNNAGVHPEILKAIEQANFGHVIAYGEDPYSASVLKKFKEHFGDQIEVFLVFNGTAANVLSLKALTDSFNSIICAECAHINVDECGAPEKFTACKLLTIPTSDGKIKPEAIQKHLHGFGFEHHSQPKVISITQPTELGTVYTPEEIRAITDLAHEHNMFVHVDGARLANAAAYMAGGATALNLSLKEITAACGLDALSFGGTKNGMMFGEAVIFFKENMQQYANHLPDFKYLRKQSMQLFSKMRFIAVQFERLLSDNLWLQNAQHANNMAKLLAKEVKKFPQIKITQKVQTNAVFAIIPKEIIPKLQKECFFYVWNENTNEVRWVTSFDTTEQDIYNFVDLLKKQFS